MNSKLDVVDTADDQKTSQPISIRSINITTAARARCASSPSPVSPPSDSTTGVLHLHTLFFQTFRLIHEIYQ
jgi:hypothetical protein